MGFGLDLVNAITDRRDAIAPQRDGDIFMEMLTALFPPTQDYRDVAWPLPSPADVYFEATSLATQKMIEQSAPSENILFSTFLKTSVDGVPTSFRGVPIIMREAA